MNLLFIQGGTRLKEDVNGKLYTDGNLNNKIWDRYKKYCDKLLILLRKEEKIYEEIEASQRFNSMNITDNMEVIQTIDLMKPKKRFISMKARRKVKRDIEQAVIKCDKAIIRSPHNFYTLNAAKYCRKYQKPYLVEVAGYAFEVYWNRGDILGKLFAPYYAMKAKKAIKKANYCVYVTQESLQKKYPTDGKELGCSDVEIDKVQEDILESRISRYKNLQKDNKLVLGTIGWVNLKLKGQQDVIKALYNLKRKNKLCFEYQLVGLGEHEYLDKLIKKYGLEENVKILGAKPHKEVFEWLKQVDIYIQPSYSEGLSRAIVEAMSMACPVVVSNAGGNPELATNNYIFEKGNVNQITKILEKITYNDLIEEAKRSNASSKGFQKDVLNNKRDNFYKEFCLNGK